MEVQLILIQSKPSDYKVCKCCGNIVWYEHDTCAKIDCTCESFDEQEGAVLKAIESEYRFWLEEGYKEEETDNILYEV